MITYDLRLKKADIEIQLDTIDMVWATLERQLEYERDEDNRHVLEQAMDALSKAYVHIEDYYYI